MHIISSSDDYVLVTSIGIYNDNRENEPLEDSSKHLEDNISTINPNIPKLLLREA